MENKYLYEFLAFQPSESFGGRRLDDNVTVWVDLVHLLTIIISDATSWDVTPRRPQAAKSEEKKKSFLGVLISIKM